MNSGFLIETFILFLTRPDRIWVRQMVRKVGQHPTPDEIQGIAWRRQRIASRIKDFHTSSNRLLGANNVAAVLGTGDILNDDGYVSDETCQPEDRGLAHSMSEIENTILAFPSTVTSGAITLMLLDLKNKECRLRRAKANDTLGHVWETLSGLLYQYINKV